MLSQNGAIEEIAYIIREFIQLFIDPLNKDIKNNPYYSPENNLIKYELTEYGSKIFAQYNVTNQRTEDKIDRNLHRILPLNITHCLYVPMSS